MAFHISPRDGQPRPCRAATPESCPVGGEHFDTKENAQSAADAKLASEYSTTEGLSKSKKIDLSKREPMQMESDGRYAVEPGEYYVVNCDAMEFPVGEEGGKLWASVVDPSTGTNPATDKMIGGYIGGEPLYTVTEGWSGVSNSLMTPKLYDALVKKGMDYTAGTPSIIEFKTKTTLGSVDGDPSESNSNYGLLEIGDKKVDLFLGEDSIAMSERTVID